MPIVKNRLSYSMAFCIVFHVFICGLCLCSVVLIFSLSVLSSCKQFFWLELLLFACVSFCCYRRVILKEQQKPFTPMEMAYKKHDSFFCQVDDTTHRNLLAIAAGVKQKRNVDTVVKKVV